MELKRAIPTSYEIETIGDRFYPKIFVEIKKGCLKKKTSYAWDYCCALGRPYSQYEDYAQIRNSKPPYSTTDKSEAQNKIIEWLDSGKK